MLVKDIMNKDVATCTPTEDLACASRVMQEYNCGFVPVVDSQGSVAGVVTDRHLPCRRQHQDSRGRTDSADRDDVASGLHM